MGTMQEEAAFFNALPSAIKASIASKLYSEAIALKEKLAANSPVKTGRYQQSWRVNKSSGSELFASISIFNPLSYATALDDGIDPGLYPSHPWVKSYVDKKTSGGLVRSKGVIWSAQRPGGTINSVFTPVYAKSLSQSLADAVVGVF